MAISIGDPNGIGIEIALRGHSLLPPEIEPFYIVSREIVEKGAQLLKIPIPNGFQIVEPEEPLVYQIDGKIGKQLRQLKGLVEDYRPGEIFLIQPGKVTVEGGIVSYFSFLGAVILAIAGEVEGIVTLPINKEGWKRANIPFKGHTDLLRYLFNGNGIMVMGVPELYVALFTEHIPFREVVNRLNRPTLLSFLLQLADQLPVDRIGVLGLNPHAGDGGVIGWEELEIIKPTIEEANRQLGYSLYFGPMVPDTAFFNPPPALVALYHDQGLAPLKALHFRSVINITLNLPIRRVSVGHGTAYDIAYQGIASLQSYLNCFHYLLSSNGKNNSSLFLNQENVTFGKERERGWK